MPNADPAIGKLALDRIVDNRVYTDPRVFEAERDRIFDRVWDFACHVSEVAETGDFFTYTLVDVPVLVVRGRDGEVRAFHNTCRHRGSMITDETSGHCGGFRCPYHFWVYSLEGELVSIPGEEAYDGSGFEKEHFPLLPVRCEVLDGLVFVTLDEEAPPLAEWLGPEVMEILGTPLGLVDYVVIETNEIDLPVNWKVPSENGRDGYHVPFVHPFFRKASPPLQYHLYRNGHAVQHLGMDPDGIEPQDWAEMQKYPLPGLEVGEGYILTIWPNLWITVRSNVVSIDTLRVPGVARTVMDHRSLGPADDDADKKAARIFSQEMWFSKPIIEEDVPIFLMQQKGVQNRFVQHSVVARGQDATTGSRGDDNRLRHFWTEWRELMGTEGNSFD